MPPSEQSTLAGAMSATQARAVDTRRHSSSQRVKHRRGRLQDHGTKEGEDKHQMKAGVVKAVVVQFKQNFDISETEEATEMMDTEHGEHQDLN